MSITIDEYFPATTSLELDGTGTRIDRFSAFGGQVAVNHNVMMPDCYSSDHETTVVLGALGLSSPHITQVTGSLSYKIPERQRQTAMGLGLPPTASVAAITTNLFRRDVLVVEKFASPDVHFDEHTIKLLNGISQGYTVAQLDEKYPPMPGQIQAAKWRLKRTGIRLGVSSLASIMTYGHVTGQLSKTIPGHYFGTQGQAGSELLGPSVELPVNTDISLEGSSLETARLDKLYFYGGLIQAHPGIRPMHGDSFTSQEMTVLGLDAIGMNGGVIARTLNRSTPCIAAARGRLARRLGIGTTMPAELVDRAFAYGLLTVEEPAGSYSLSRSLPTYIKEVANGQSHTAALAAAGHDRVLPHIIKQRAPTPAAAVTYAYLHGLRSNARAA